MWHQSALFDCNLSDEAWGDVYYPESWRSVLNEEYFQNLRETMIRTPVPEDTDYYDSLDLRMDFVEHLQAAVLGKKADDGEEEEPASWIPYSTFADIPDVEIAN